MQVAQDITLVSRRIFTMDDRSTVMAGAVVVRNGRIAEVLPEGAPPPADTAVIDLGDRPVLPGFIDAHVHLEMGSTALWHAVDCHTPPCSSVADVVEQLAAHAERRFERGGWLLGQGGLFADRRFAEERLPTRSDLDKVSVEFPIAVKFGGHSTVLNSKALEIALERGLTQGGAGVMDRDGDGQLNGIIRDLYHLLPIPDLTQTQREQGITGLARKLLVGQGVTTIGEISDTPDGLRYIASVAGTQALPLRVLAFAWAPGTWPIDTVLDAEAGVFPEATDSFRMQGIKLFADGGISAAGAAMLQPYLQMRDGKPHYGRLAYDLDELADIIRRADDCGLQVAVHGVGDRAQRLLCDAATLARPDGAAGLLPVRLEHGGNILGELATVDFWRSAGAVPVSQAAMLWSLGSVVPDYTGDYVRPGLFPFRTLLDQGWDLATSSDGSGSEPLNYNPLFGIQCAVNRTTCLGEVLNPQEQISVMEGLRMYTAAAAAALGLTDEIGSLESGKAADIVVLEADPREVPVDEIAQVKVDRVYRDGALVGGREHDVAAV